jgi:hypothetical protein
MLCTEFLLTLAFASRISDPPTLSHAFATSRFNAFLGLEWKHTDHDSGLLCPLATDFATTAFSDCIALVYSERQDLFDIHGVVANILTAVNGGAKAVIVVETSDDTVPG